MRPFGFQPAAAQEAAAAAEYYDSKSTGLGFEFLSDLDDCITVAREFPESGAPFESSSRRLLFRRFPFSLIYTFDRDRIEIVAVAHQRRKPGYWQDRLG